MNERQRYRQGQRRLRDWLPAARAAVAKDDGGKMEAGNAIGAAMLPHLTEDNLDALLIHPAPLGGWHVDLVLKKVPPGVACAFGTPKSAPLGTSAEAETYARRLLNMALAQSRRAKAEAAPAAFQLHDWTVQLPAPLLDAAMTLMPEHAGGYGSPEQAEVRVASAVARLFPSGIPGTDGLDSLPRQALAELLGVLVRAALSGLLRYPAVPDKPPASHDGSGATP